MEIEQTPPHLRALYAERDAAMRIYNEAVAQHGMPGKRLKARGQLEDIEVDALAVQAHNSHQTRFAGRAIHVTEQLDARLHSNGLINSEENEGYVRIRIDDSWQPGFWIQLSMKRSAFLAHMQRSDTSEPPPLVTIKGRIEGGSLHVHPTQDPDWPHLRISRRVNRPNDPFKVSFQRTTINSCTICIRHPHFPLFWIDLQLALSDLDASLAQ